MMINEKHNGPTSALWAYGYALAPAVARKRMGGVQTVLDRGRTEADLAGRIWEGRFVNGAYITHILVVSDTPAQDRDVNHRLEAELLRLKAGFSVTAPLEVGPGRRRPSSGNGPSESG